MSKKKIFVAGHNGLVGSAIVKCLRKKNLDIITKEKKNLNLLNQNQVLKFFKKEKIDEIYIAAAKVGGIFANQTYPAQFIYENLMISLNLIHTAFLCKIKKLMYLGSSCIYPKNAKMPLKEEYLLDGKLETSNEYYAISKISGLKLCQAYNLQYAQNGIDYRALMPSNIYGQRDNYSEMYGHVIPALISRFHESKIKKKPYIKIWGSGKPKREFLYVDDLAEAIVYVMNLKKTQYYKFVDKNSHFINIGSGEEISIKNLAKMIKKITGYKGKLYFDRTKPDGVHRKILRLNKIKKLGWKPKVSLEEGLSKTYNYYEKNYKKLKIKLN